MQDEEKNIAYLVHQNIFSSFSELQHNIKLQHIFSSLNFQLFFSLQTTSYILQYSFPSF